MSLRRQYLEGIYTSAALLAHLKYQSYEDNNQPDLLHMEECFPEFLDPARGEGLHVIRQSLLINYLA
jgi:hypothetical protein